VVELRVVYSIDSAMTTTPKSDADTAVESESTGQSAVWYTYSLVIIGLMASINVCLVILYCRLKRMFTILSRTNELEGKLSMNNGKKNEQELDEIVSDGVALPNQTGGAVTKGGNNEDIDTEIVYDQNGGSGANKHGHEATESAQIFDDMMADMAEE